MLSDYLLTYLPVQHCQHVTFSLFIVKQMSIDELSFQNIAYLGPFSSGILYVSSRIPNVLHKHFSICLVFAFFIFSSVSSCVFFFYETQSRAEQRRGEVNGWFWVNRIALTSQSVATVKKTQLFSLTFMSYFSAGKRDDFWKRKMLKKTIPCADRFIVTFLWTC